MLLHKLNSDDLQFERMNPFDGSMAYAQNKRQQVVMTDYWAKQHPEIHFSTMHPGKNRHESALRIRIFPRIFCHYRQIYNKLVRNFFCRKDINASND